MLLKIRRFGMCRSAFLAAALIVLLPAGPCFAVDAKQKMATCNFGADQQRLQGKPRDDFLKKCMEDRDDPRGPAPAGAVTAPKQ
jgi:psiF repeat-containing protein